MKFKQHVRIVLLIGCDTDGSAILILSFIHHFHWIFKYERANVFFPIGRNPASFPGTRSHAAESSPVVYFP